MDIFGGSLVIIAVIFILLSLYLEWIGPAYTFLVAVVFLGIFGVLSPSEILTGFANEQLAVIILLILLGDIIRRTSVIEIAFERIFKKANTVSRFRNRMMIMVGFFSAFLNNTPLVAIMMPFVHNWSKKHNESPSKLLIPLSYAAILGGCVTLIGTSTNLIVSGFVQDQSIIPNLKPLNMFDFAWVGVPALILGYIYLALFSNRMLPWNKDALSDISKSSRKFIVEAQIRPKSHLINKPLQESGLIGIEGLFLFEIKRDDKTIKVNAAGLVLKENDLLRFAAESANVADLMSDTSGLTFPKVGMLKHKSKTELVEVVVSHNSTLISKEIQHINFRAKFNAALVAVHRNGERITGVVDDVKLKAGDVLLLLADDLFEERIAYSSDVYYISQIKEVRRLGVFRTTLLLGGTLLAIVLSAFRIIPLFMGIMVLLLILLPLKITSPKDLHKSIDYDLILIIALAIALGNAMLKTGVADAIANLFIGAFLPWGHVALLSGIYLTTAIMAAYITNKAAVALIFPISLSLAANLDLNPMPFILVVAFAAAANFITPHGYQTNLMVYGPGRYTFKDFFKIGLPLTIMYMIVTITVLSIMYF
ncbi:MAG: SLC13 family permease [Salinivirgaceae bacterium]|jgi:di/tricarboxylate transporter|nr:SLC13 family permease [Salinivirgaceae bacterium]